MQRHVKRIVLLVVGWGFILLGIAGLFLPILQGILFLLIGLFILSGEYAWAHRLLYRLRDRFPAIASHFDSAKERAERWFHAGKRTEKEPQPVSAANGQKPTASGQRPTANDQ